MAKKSTTKNGASDDAKQKALELTPAEPKVSKAEAVRRAVGAGVQSPTEGVAYLMEHFGIEMDNKTFSLNRSQQKARDAKATTRGRPGRKPRAAGQPAPAAATSRSRGADIITDIESVKDLIDKHGKDGVKRLVDALG